MSDMTIAEFEERCIPAKSSLDSQPLLFWAVGFGEEAGEVLGVVKKLTHRGEEVFGMQADERLIDEAGDALFYLRQVLAKRGLSLADAAQHELEKIGAMSPGDP